jgi:predicted hydrocarbon binding protein
MDGMQPPEAAGPHLHGQIVVARFEYLKRNHGSEAIQRILEALPEADRVRLAGVERNSWYPFATLIRLDREIAQYLGGSAADVYERLGEASAQQRTLWLGEHAALVNVHGFLVRMAEEHRRFHNFGIAEYRRINFSVGEISFSDYPENDPIYCLSAKGYFRRSIEHLTGGPVTADERYCQSRGDIACVWTLRWAGRSDGAIV